MHPCVVISVLPLDEPAGNLFLSLEPDLQHEVFHMLEAFAAFRRMGLVPPEPIGSAVVRKMADFVRFMSAEDDHAVRHH